MNGEMNGKMDEPMETSAKSPENNIIDTPADDLHSSNSKSSSTAENSIRMNNESGSGPYNESTENCSGKESVDHSPTTTITAESETKTEEHSSDTENTKNGNLNSHCTNSNESCSVSIASFQDESETNENQELLSMDEKSKVEDSETNCKKPENANGGEIHEVDSEEDSSEEEGRAEDAVSINSDSESEENNAKNSSNDVIIVENDDRPDPQNGNSHDSPSPEVHEILSDNEDCILANEEKSNSNTNDVKGLLRRSSRAIKRKRYTDELENGNGESDIEEVEMEDPLNNRRSNTIVINNTKTLVEMAARRMKSNQNNVRKEPTMVIIDSGRKCTSKNACLTSTSKMTAQNLYQSIVARGTTVTPISSKINTSTQSSPPVAQPLILPSLTDDMFVVEAPSFIVPYVYEKPSIQPFREFVDKLGKELESQKAKDEKDRLDKVKEAKEKRHIERKEKRERGEEVTESEDEAETTNKTEEAKKKKKAEKRERRRRRNDDDDASWDGESDSESDDETLSDEEDKTVVIKDKAFSIDQSIDEIKHVTDLTGEMTNSSKSDNYFGCSLGKFFINIGLNLVQEYVQTDLLKQQNRKLYREKKSGHSTKATESSIASLNKNIEFSKENNAPYSFRQIKCEFCSFKTESMLSMSHHLETPHMKNNVYKCNYCSFEIRSPHDILYHMEAEHNVRGKLERAPSYHQCPNCPFEDNGKGKLARHQIACAKKYKPEQNLAPPFEWEPPAKIPKITKTRNNMMGSYQNTFNRQVGSNMGISIANLMAGAGAGGGAGGGYRARGRSPMAVPGRNALAQGAPVVRGGVMVRQNTTSSPIIPSNYSLANNGRAKSQPSISITPLPRQPQPTLPQPLQQSKSSFVICEICDGYIKDLEQLRNHMQWIHKVKIHPKMIYNRPPLNCQKCQFRFFTDQGLERHLLGSHGLVTSSMQEAANKGKDAGRCPVCGRVYQWKLLNHVARDHNLTLKPAHLSYKCTVCTATFGMYKQFENHVYSAHSVVAKRVIDKSKASPAPAKPNDSLLKPLKINDEITITPQPMKSATSTKNK